MYCLQILGFVAWCTRLPTTIQDSNPLKGQRAHSQLMSGSLQKNLPTVTKQCQLLNIARSTAHYRPKQFSDEELALMRLIDEIHFKLPAYGSRRIRDELETHGHLVSLKKSSVWCSRCTFRHCIRRNVPVSRARDTRSIRMILCLIMFQNYYNIADLLTFFNILICLDYLF